jgi:hypothetical protein
VNTLTTTNLNGKLNLLEHNPTARTFTVNTKALPVQLSTAPDRYDFTFVGEHIFKFKTTLTDFQAYPDIDDPT